jgi:hypothetical protein
MGMHETAGTFDARKGAVMFVDSRYTQLALQELARAIYLVDTQKPLPQIVNSCRIAERRQRHSDRNTQKTRWLLRKPERNASSGFFDTNFCYTFVLPRSPGQDSRANRRNKLSSIRVQDSVPSQLPG